VLLRKKRSSRSPLRRPVRRSPRENLVKKKEKVHPAADRRRAALGAKRRARARPLNLKLKIMTKRKHSSLLP